MPLPPPAIEPVQITVVESPACHFCADAHHALAALATNYAIRVETIDMRSEIGRALIAQHRAPMSPLVLLDGKFFSSGRLPRRKLEKTLSGRGLAVPQAGPVEEGTRHG